MVIVSLQTMIAGLIDIILKLPARVRFDHAVFRNILFIILTKRSLNVNQDFREHLSFDLNNMFPDQDSSKYVPFYAITLISAI